MLSKSNTSNSVDATLSVINARGSWLSSRLRGPLCKHIPAAAAFVSSVNNLLGSFFIVL